MLPRQALIYISLACSVLYALETTFVDKRLKHVPPITLTFWTGVGIVLISGLMLLTTHKSHAFLPTRETWPLLITVTILFFGADYTHFYVLNQRAGAVLLSTTYLLIPILASLFEVQIPSAQLVLAWIFGFVALVLLFAR